jgi:hypothetical protein
MLIATPKLAVTNRCELGKSALPTYCVAARVPSCERVCRFYRAEWNKRFFPELPLALTLRGNKDENYNYCCGCVFCAWVRVSPGAGRRRSGWRRRWRWRRRCGSWRRGSGRGGRWRSRCITSSRRQLDHGQEHEQEQENDQEYEKEKEAFNNVKGDPALSRANCLISSRCGHARPNGEFFNDVTRPALWRALYLAWEAARPPMPEPLEPPPN